MLVCPACARIFDPGTSVCAHDGVFLEPARDPLTGCRHGSYLFMGPLGRGGMGAVYRGEHVVIGKPVALKVLHPRLARIEQVVDRFLIEARAASMIRHRNIVDVTDFGELPDRRPFFVMEFLEGPNLEQEISRHGSLPLFRTVSILSQAARALHACHQRGVVHRDLKPENIVLLSREGNRELVELPADPSINPTVRKEGQWDEVRILDFGVARIQEMTAALDAETREQGIVFGSPYYVSPEQSVGETGDHRSDIYALGVIFFEMLTGQVPFDGETAQEIMTHHTTTPPPDLRTTRPDLDLPEEAETLVQRSLAKRPQDRHRSAARFYEDLTRCFGDVIYGRDIDRFLEVRRNRTQRMASASPSQVMRRLGDRPAPTAAGDPKDSSAPAASAPPAGAPAPPPAVSEQLEELFRGKYEPPRPVTQSTLEAIEKRSAPRKQPAPDPQAVREELKGLFGPDDEE